MFKRPPSGNSENEMESVQQLSQRRSFSNHKEEARGGVEEDDQVAMRVLEGLEEQLHQTLFRFGDELRAL